jgi:Ku protein
VRKDTGEHVEPDDVVRAFELEDGRYVPIEPEDLDHLDVELTHSVDICDFVCLDEIDPIYFRQAYYLVPQNGGEKPYRLLVEALAETGRVGIAKVVIRNKQHLACLRPYEGPLVIETMYYADEVRSPVEVAGEGGGEDGLRKAERAPLPEPREEEAQVVDLMQALRESVERTQKARSSRKAS